MSWEMIINNAQVVLRKEIFEGSIGIRDGKITGLTPPFRHQMSKLTLMVTFVSQVSWICIPTT